MCIAIYKPANKRITKDSFEECWWNNGDGLGFAYVENKTIVVKKGFMKKEAALKELLAHEDKELVIHFRKASQGMVVDENNCHPFLVAHEGAETAAESPWQLAMVHNGRLEWRSEKEKSDTNCFFNDCIAPHFLRDPWFLDYEYARIMMRRMIVNSVTRTENKLIFLRYNAKDDKTSVFIINDQLGNWHDGCWYSNYSYVPSSKKTYLPGMGGMGGVYGYEYDAEAEAACGFSAKRQKYEAIWGEPDKHGWKWSFVRHGWLNERTAVFTYNLSSRPDKPYDNTTYAKMNPFFTDVADHQYEKKKNKKEKKKGGALDHLTKPEIEELVMCGEGLLVQDGFKFEELAKLGRLGAINYLRDQSKKYIKEAADFDDIFLDDYLVTLIKRGELEGRIDAGKQEAEFSDAAEKELAKQQAESNAKVIGEGHSSDAL